MKRKNLLVKDCRHRRSWLMVGGSIEWCYQCGAIRRMKHVETGENSVTPASKWSLPTGKNGHNPWKSV